MDRAGLNPHDFGLAARALALPHYRKFELEVLDLADGSHLRSLTLNVLDGQVSYDATATAEATRMLDIHFLDARNKLGFEPDDPSDAPLHRSRMLRVGDLRFIDALGGWVRWNCFTGPIIDFERQGGDVNITAHGMERQAYGAAWHSIHCAKKSKITDAIRKLLAAAGDVNANVPDLPHQLPKDLVVHPLDPIWPHVKKLAAALDRYPLYDGSGRFHLRPHAMRHPYRFHKAVLGPVDVKRTVDGFINTVVVLGPKPHGPKKRIRGEATLKGTLSPSDLNRNGVPLHQPLVVNRDHLDSKKHADAIAARLLTEHATTRTDLSFESMPLPFLEEHDMVAVTDDSFGTARMRMRQWSLPLEGGEAGTSTGSPMNVGSIRRTTKARIKRR